MLSYAGFMAELFHIDVDALSSNSWYADVTSMNPIITYRYWVDIYQFMVEVLARNGNSITCLIINEIRTIIIINTFFVPLL